MVDRAAWMRDNVRRLLRAADTRTRRQEVDDDVAKNRAHTPEERDRSLQAVVRASHQQILDTGGYARVNALEEKPAADLEQIWRRQVALRNSRR